MLKKFTLILSMLALALVLCSSVSAAGNMTTQVNPNANGDSLNPAISGNGGNITFSSDASNLVNGDTNGKSDIFVADNQTGNITRVSVSSSGVQSNGNSYDPSISSNGRYVVFDSVANNLVPFDTNGCSDIFLHDMITGTTIGISVPFYGNNYNPSISGDGHYVAYEHYNTTVEGSNGFSWIFIYDTVTGTTSVINNSFTFSDPVKVYYNLEANTIQLKAQHPSISNAGYVAFESFMYYLPPFNFNYKDIVRYDITHPTNTTYRNIVSITPYGYPANGPSYNPSINNAGTIIAFQSNANNLADDTNANSDIFVHDMTIGLTYRVSVNSNGEQANGGSFNPSISGDGNYVTYYSFASNLVSGDTNDVSDVFFSNCSDPTAIKTFRASVDSNGDQFSFGSSLPAISSDGRYVTFLSKPGISSGYEKVLVHDCAWNANTNIASGDYYAPQSVVFTANPGVTIYYTTNGSDPTTGSTLYTGPITINTTQTLKYIAVNGSNQSPVNTRIYRIYAWELYSYQVTIAYKLSNKKYKIKYTVPYTVKKRIRTKVGNKWKYTYVNVTKYKIKYRWDYHYGYRTETRWDYHWVLK